LSITNIIRENGYYSSNNIISDEDLSQLRNFIDLKLKEFPNKNFRLYEDSFKNTVIDDKKFEDKINKIISEVLRDNNINDYKKPNYKVLRVVSGVQQKKQAYLYHFDAHLITILIPIIIPNNKSGKNGDLVIFPNLRKVHKNLILNIIQKIFFQNFISRTLLNTKLLRKIFNYKLLKIKPGNVYMFFGFRSLHANLEIETFSTRATLLIHCYDVFENSSIVKMNRKQSINKEIKNIKV